MIYCLLPKVTRRPPKDNSFSAIVFLNESSFSLPRNVAMKILLASAGFRLFFFFSCVRVFIIRKVKKLRVVKNQEFNTIFF